MATLKNNTRTLRTKLLYKFLVKNRALHAYVNEIIKQRPCNQAVKDYKENKDLMSLLNWFNDINSSIQWVQTSQGWSFWNKLSGTFLQFEANFLSHEYQS